MRLVPAESPLGFFLEVGVLGLFGGDGDAQESAALQFARGGESLADRITALVADALAPAQPKLASLSSHRAFGHHLVVDIQLGPAKGRRLC